MKKAKEQLEREHVMQVLKNFYHFSAYSLAGVSVTDSSVVVGTHVYNQCQYQQPQRRSSSLTSSGSDERVPPLTKRRTQQQQPSPPLSTSLLEQVALVTTQPHSTSAPPSWSASNFSNPEGSTHAHVHRYPNTTSPFRPKSWVPIDSFITIPYASSPEQSLRCTSLDLPSASIARGPFILT